jgi:hypothetical protein
MKKDATTLNIMTLSIMTLIKMTLNVMTLARTIRNTALSITIHSLMTVNAE